MNMATTIPPGKLIETHHDGHGLTESIIVLAADEVGPGGAHHRYDFAVQQNVGEPYVNVGYLQFQKGPRNEPGSTPGVLSVAVLAALLDIHRAFQAGEFPSPENAEVIFHIEGAMDALKRRADERATRGVLGHNKI